MSKEKKVCRYCGLTHSLLSHSPCYQNEVELNDQLVKALKPFAHPDLSLILSNNRQGNNSIVFQRNYAELTIGDFVNAQAVLKAVGEDI